MVQDLEVMPSPELDRIVAIPRRAPVDPSSVESEAMVRIMTARYRRDNPSCDCAARARECITTLRPVQAWALYELGLYGTSLGLIGTGHGKTLLNILGILPLRSRGVQTGCLLVPASLMGQLIADYEHISQHFMVPSLYAHGRGETSWSRDVADMPVLHVLPYSRLQRAEYSTWLETLSPELIIADEADYLANPATATTSRLLRAMARRPKTIFVPWSGSITSTSIKEYWHLSAFALREHSPLPLTLDITEDWSRAIDPSDDPAPEGALDRLRTDPGQSLYEAFHRRLVETPGVIHTREGSVDIPLQLRERKIKELPAVIQEAFRSLREEWVRPDHLAEGYDGEPCEQYTNALEVSACALQLACGFFYRWRYPRGEPRELIREWLEARADYNREVRNKLRARHELLDSELLCREAAMRAWGDAPKDPRLPTWRSEHWPRWRDIEEKVKPESEAVILHDFLSQDAAEWALQERGIVWYSLRALGKRIAKLSGLPLHTGGPKAGELILRETGERSIIASINSHGRGRDGLQRIFSTQLITQPQSNPTDWEQLLARLSRPDQRASCVYAWFYQHTPELKAQQHKALIRAPYVQGTIGSKQKLLGATT